MAKQKSREIQSLKELKFGSTNVMELRADQPSLPQRNRASHSDILSQVNLDLLNARTPSPRQRYKKHLLPTSWGAATQALVAPTTYTR